MQRRIYSMIEGSQFVETQPGEFENETILEFFEGWWFVNLFPVINPQVPWEDPKLSDMEKLFESVKKQIRTGCIPKGMFIDCYCLKGMLKRLIAKKRVLLLPR